MTYGFSSKGVPVDEPGEDESGQTVEKVIKYSMPNLMNHTTDYADQKLSGMNVVKVVLGDGRSVIDQYPREGSFVVSGQRVFLLTDTSSFIMPDLTGWTRKDVASLWAVTGFGFQLTGEGKVISQNIPPGTAVTRGTSIKVVFATKKPDEDGSSDGQSEEEYYDEEQEEYSE
jgi:beta-lactam-binding protein with PASTA domain